MNKLDKVIKTAWLMLSLFCIGLCLEIAGPTLIDMKVRIRADYEQVATALSGRFVGFFIGSAIGGVLVDKLDSYCDLLTGVSLTCLAAVTICVPFSPTVEVLWGMIALQGTCDGLINIVCHKLILKLWTEDAASPLHILQGGFGVGSFLIPLIASPFLAEPKPGTDLNTTINTTVRGYQNDSTISLVPDVVGSSQHNESSTPGIISEEFLRDSRIEIPYSIAALVTLLVASAFYTYHIRGLRSNDAQSLDQPTQNNTNNNTGLLSRNKRVLESIKKMINPATCAGGRFVYGAEIFFLLALYFANMAGGESIMGKFIRAYSIEQLGFSVNEGTYLNTIFWLSFAAGRILGFVIARYVPVQALILVESGGALTSTILLNVFAPSSPTALWVLTIFTGLFISPGYPSGTGWANRHVELTGTAIAFMSLGGSVGGVVYLRLAGYLFETYGPRSFLYHVMGFGIASFVIAVLLNVVGSQHGNRFLGAKGDPGEPATTDTRDTEMNETEKMIPHNP